MEKKCLGQVLKQFGWCDFVHKKKIKQNIFKIHLKKIVIKMNFKIKKRLFIGLSLVPCLFFLQNICNKNFRFHKIRKSLASWNIRSGTLFSSSIILQKKQMFFFL